MTKKTEVKHHLRYWLDQKGYSVRKFSLEVVDDTGEPLWSASTWQNLCSGSQQPNLEHMLAATKVLGITLDQLVDPHSNRAPVTRVNKSNVIPLPDEKELSEVLDPLLSMIGADSKFAPELAHYLRETIVAVQDGEGRAVSPDHYYGAASAVARQYRSQA